LANVIERDLGLRRFVAEMQNARNASVVIGLQEGDVNGEGKSIATYGAENEFGTTKIPERSFMRSAFDEKAQDISRSISAKFNKVQAGAMTVHSALSILGEEHQDHIKRKIGSNIQPGNSHVTIAQKGSSQTLIDTGAMLNSVRYILRPR
jgi:hypothetical protein